MKKAFTLVELLVVVVVLVTLMTISFRLSSVGGDSTKRNVTVSRMNRLENCLSGYYAAFGSYPPVALHGYRDIYMQVDMHGIQDPTKPPNKSIWGWYKDSGDHGLGSSQELVAWDQVKAACKAQPVDCRFPYSDSYNEVLKAYSQKYQMQIQNNPDKYSEDVKARFSAPIDNGWSENPGRHSKNMDKTSWNDAQLFKFGLMSYLLPRYLVMMSFGEGSGGNAHQFASELFGTSKPDASGNVTDGYAQWTENNIMPHDPFKGDYFAHWTEIFECVSKGSQEPQEYARVTSIPSQAVTARWLPNLEGIVTCSHKYELYGISIKDTTDHSGGLSGDPNTLEIYSPAGLGSNSTQGQYMLDKVTIRDGWETELFYYSPAPHQTYMLWSAGKNGRTFPPWITRDSLSQEAGAAKCVGVWTSDDIMRMNN